MLYNKNVMLQDVMHWKESNGLQKAIIYPKKSQNLSASIKMKWINIMWEIDIKCQPLLSNVCCTKTFTVVITKNVLAEISL